MKKIAILVAVLMVGVFSVTAFGQTTLAAPYVKAYQDQSVSIGERGLIGWKVLEYDYARHGGGASVALGTIASNAIVMQVIVDVERALLPALTTTNSLRMNSGADLMAASTNTLKSTGIKAGTPVDTASTAVKATADRTIYLINVGTVTQGNFRAYCKYYMGK